MRVGHPRNGQGPNNGYTNFPSSLFATVSGAVEAQEGQEKKTELVRIRVKMTLIWYATIFLTSSKPLYANAIMDFCFSGVQFRGSLQERMNLRSN